MSRLSRSEILLGTEGLSKLHGSEILIVGLGGVGGYAAECLVRAGVGKITLVDGDVVDESNLNRQLVATSDNVGCFKVTEYEKRFKSVNPGLRIRTLNIFYSEQTSSLIFDRPYDYCIDCFDSVKEKLHFIITAKRLRFPVISAMGAGNRLCENFEVTDIFKTAYDKLAKKLRKELKYAGVETLKVVCDKNAPSITGNTVIGSVSYIPAIMGCMLAGEVIRDITGMQEIKI